MTATSPTAGAAISVSSLVWTSVVAAGNLLMNNLLAAANSVPIAA